MQETPLQTQKTLFEVINGLEQFNDFISQRRSIVLFFTDSADTSKRYISQLRQDASLEKYLIEHKVGIALVDADKNIDISEKERVKVTPYTVGYNEGRRIGFKLGPLTTEKFIDDCVANWYCIPPQKR